MANIGKVKASSEQDDEGKLALTTDETTELEALLTEAKKAAEDATTDKATGVITLEIAGGKIKVGTGKVKIEPAQGDK
jgi:hypothetical protein